MTPSRALSASLGLDASRGLDPARYAIGAAVPHAAVRPATWEELADAVQAAARDHLGVVPWGGGVSLPRESAPDRYDVAIDLSGLNRIVEYEPDDFTITAECGCTIASLRETLAARGHELPIEVALPARATLGGALAANASGPRRRALGAPRDRILGARYVLGDGSTARTGGKVVKNVAGYGVHRLLCGSRGGLAIVVHGSLKLMPAPAKRVALRWSCGPEVVADRARWSSLGRLELAALTVLSSDRARAAGIEGPSDFTIVAGLEEDAARIAEQEHALEVMLGDPLAREEGDAAVARLQSLADLEEGDGNRATLATADASPAALAGLIALSPAASFVFHAPAGRLLLWADAGEARTLATVLKSGEFVPIDSRPAGAFDAAPAPSDAVAAMRAALRGAIDPTSRFALGEAWVRRAL